MQAQLKAQQKVWLDAEQKAQSACKVRLEVEFKARP